MRTNCGSSGRRESRAAPAVSSRLTGSRRKRSAAWPKPQSRNVAKRGSRLQRTAQADEDLIAIWTYIGRNSPRAADRLLDRLNAKSLALARNPRSPLMTAPERPASSVDPKLLEVLVCPLTKCRLEYDAEKQELISRSAKLAYPIRDGIPIMLAEEARKLD